MYLLAEDPPLGLQMVQMGQGLSHGKELLRQGKIRPVPGSGCSNASGLRSDRR